MGWVAAAIAAAGALGSGALGAGASDKAASAQQKAAREQMDFQRWLYEQQTQRSEPWRAVGQGALNQLAQLYGIPYMPYSPGTVGGSSSYSPGVSRRISGSQSVAQKLLDPGDLFGLGGSHQGRWMSGEGSQFTAKQVIRLLKQGRSIEEIAKLGSLDTNLDPKRLRKLGKAGLDADEIKQLQYGPMGLPQQQEMVTPTGPDMSVFQASPDYQFRRDEGNRNILGGFGAQGNAFSGNALRALNEYNSNLASQEFGNFVNRRETLAGLGQSAVGQQQQAGNYFGSYGGNAIQNAGDARASGIANQANMWGNTLSQLGQIGGYAYGQYNSPQNAYLRSQRSYFNSMFPGG